MFTAIVEAIVKTTDVSYIRVQKADLKLTAPDTATFSCLFTAHAPYVASKKKKVLCVD